MSDRAAGQSVLRAGLSLAVVQPVPHDDDLGSSVVAHADLVRAARARVVVFPELSLTGYRLDAPDVPLDSAVLGPLIAACAETGAIAFVGAPVDGRIAFVAVDGSGAGAVYSKVHVDESELGRFRPGPGPSVFEVDGWRVGFAICRDTRFPEHDEAVASLGVDVIVSGVVHHAHEDGVTGERAVRIARSRRTWVAVASHAGGTGEGFDHTAGRSGIWAPSGEEVVRADASPGSFVGATLTDDRAAIDGSHLPRS